jgi:hypothetical protein
MRSDGLNARPWTPIKKSGFGAVERIITEFRGGGSTVIVPRKDFVRGRRRFRKKEGIRSTKNPVYKSVENGWTKR